MAEENKGLVATNRELQDQVSSFHSKLTKSRKRQDVAVAELQNSTRLAEEHKKALME